MKRKPYIRLKGYDYSQSNYYFVTLCTQNKRELFGAIRDNQMLLSERWGSTDTSRHLLGKLMAAVARPCLAMC